jgi:hypothetical protein
MRPKFWASDGSDGWKGKTRHAHARNRDMGLDCHFRHREGGPTLAEASPHTRRGSRFFEIANFDRGVQPNVLVLERVR